MMVWMKKVYFYIQYIQDKWAEESISCLLHSRSAENDFSVHANLFVWRCVAVLMQDKTKWSNKTLITLI